MSKFSNEDHEAAKLYSGNLSLIDSNQGGRRAYLSVICLILCSAVMAGVPAVRSDQTATGQAPIEALHVPELDAGFSPSLRTKA